MTAREQGFLLLTGYLGDPDEKPLTVAQFRRLAQMAAIMEKPTQDRELTESDLIGLGCQPEFARRVVGLLSREQRLQRYLEKGWRADCVPITRISEAYPDRLRKVLHLDAPGTLWTKGDLALLSRRLISVVGSRELRAENHKFAQEVGRQAALQGYTLVSGNARGADRIAQESCLRNGGSVVSVVADELEQQPRRENVLYISEMGFDQPFATPRALQRNRIIHSLSRKTFVVQSTVGKGGTWSGACNNLQHGWSQVICFSDNSEASRQLECRGAVLADIADLVDFEKILPKTISFIDDP